MNRLPARDLNGLLKFCIENTRAEDASGDVPSTVRPEDITPERREFLRAALEQCSADREKESLVGCIKCLTEEDSVMSEGADVARQEEALDIIEDWTDNIDMANSFYALGGHQALRLCLRSPHNSLAAGSMNAIGVIAQNNPLSQDRLFEEGFLQVVLERIAEEKEDASVSKKGILAVSAMTRGHRPSLDSMDKDKLQTVANTLILIVDHDSTIDPVWNSVRSKTAFYLACIMEESAQVQRALTDLCLAAHLVAVMRFHHDEASENVARCLEALVKNNPKAIKQCRDSVHNFSAVLAGKIDTLKTMNVGEDEGTFDEELQYCKSICSMVYPDANDVLVGGQGDLRGSPSIGGEDDRADFSGEAFQATSEWQDVKPGQVLPAGLHYRINMETGKKEAKILDRKQKSYPIVASSVDH